MNNTLQLSDINNVQVSASIGSVNVGSSVKPPIIPYYKYKIPFFALGLDGIQYNTTVSPSGIVTYNAFDASSVISSVLASGFVSSTLLSPSGNTNFNYSYIPPGKNTNATVIISPSNIYDCISNSGGNQTIGKHAMALAATVIKKKTPSSIFDVFPISAEVELNNVISSAIQFQLKSASLRTRILVALGEVNPLSVESGPGVYRPSLSDPEIDVLFRIDLSITYTALQRPRRLTLKDFPVMMTLSNGIGPSFRLNTFDVGTLSTNIAGIDNEGRIMTYGQSLDYNGDGLPDIHTEMTHLENLGSLDGRVTISIGNGPNVCAAIDTYGDVHTWGPINSTVGYHGNGETTTSTIPKYISDMGSLAGKVAVYTSVGAKHVLVLDTSGNVHGWGPRNVVGIDSSSNQYNVPVLMLGGLTGKVVIDIASGNNVSAALDSSGKVYTWGVGTNGALGRGVSSVNVLTPSMITTGSLVTANVKELEVCNLHMVAIDSSGVVHAWGRCGNITNMTDANSPISYATSGSLVGKTIINVASTGSGFVCVDSQGSVHAAGWVPAGIVFNKPTQITYGSFGAYTMTNIYAGPYSILAVDTIGRAHLWGNKDPENSNKILNIAPSVGFVPSIVDPMISGYVAPSDLRLQMAGQVDASHQVMADKNGKVYTWGDAGGTMTWGTNPLVPVNISGYGSLSTAYIMQVGISKNFSMALDKTGGVHTWGMNCTSGQLGNGTNTSLVEPARIVGISNVIMIQIATSSSGSCYGLDASGRIYVWGNNSNSQLGDGLTSNRNVPYIINSTGTLSGQVVRFIAAGIATTYALDTLGRLHGWGSGLGLPGGANATTPTLYNTHGTLATASIRFKQVAAGRNIAFAVDSSGKVHAWGVNTNGQLGNGSFTTSNTTPAYVGGTVSTTIITKVTAGDNYGMAIDTSGRLHLWGGNNKGQLGNGNNNNIHTPFIGSNVLYNGKFLEDISANHQTSYAMDREGNIYTWGNNAGGQIGNNTKVDASLNILPAGNMGYNAITVPTATPTPTPSPTPTSTPTPTPTPISTATPTPTPLPITYDFTLPDRAYIITRYNSWFDGLDKHASWIWNYPNANIWAPTGDAIFEVKVLIPASSGLVAATLNYLVDNVLRKVNLNKIDIYSGPDTGTFTMPIKSYSTNLVLRPGSNIIKMTFANVGAGSAGVIFTVTRTSDGAILAKSDSNTRIAKALMPPVTSGLVGYYDGKSWTGSSWNDNSGKNNHATAISGSILTTNYELYNGSSMNYISGTTASRIAFPSGIATNDYTFMAVARYTNPTINRGRIFDGSGTNYVMGFWGGKSGVAFHGNQVLGGPGFITQETHDLHGNDWVLLTDMPGLFRSNMADRTTNTNKIIIKPNLFTINWGHFTGGASSVVVSGQAGSTNEASDWAVSCVLVFNRSLTSPEIEAMEKWIYYAYMDVPAIVDLDARNITSQLDAIVASWPNSTPRKNEVAILAASGINGPILRQKYNINNNNWLRYVELNRAYSQHFTVPTLTIPACRGITIFVVAALTSVGYWERLFDFGVGSNNNNIILARSGSSTTITSSFRNGTSSNYIDVANYITDNEFHVYAMVINGSSSANNTYITLYRDYDKIPQISGMFPRMESRTLSSNYIGRSNWEVDSYTHGDFALFRWYDYAMPQDIVNDIRFNMANMLQSRPNTSIMVNNKLGGHIMALDTLGNVYGWGKDNSGQVGNNASYITQDNVPTPGARIVPYPTLVYGSLRNKYIVQIVTSENVTMALDSIGGRHAWGSNAHGVFGNNTTASSVIPISIGSFGTLLSAPRIRQIALGARSTYAIDINGQVHAWGDNAIGQLGNGNTISSLVPVLVSAGAMMGRKVAMLACGEAHVIAVDASRNSVYTWGSNVYGQVGNNKVNNGGINGVHTPVNISATFAFGTTKSVKLIDCGRDFSVVVLDTNDVFVWGRNNAWQCGNNAGTSVDVPIPTKINAFGNLATSLGTNNIIMLSTGSEHTMMCDSAKNMYAWGSNTGGRIGNNISTDPVKVPTLLNFTADLVDKTIVDICMGNTSSFAIDSENNLYAWGSSNNDGALGFYYNQTNKATMLGKLSQAYVPEYFVVYKLYTPNGANNLTLDFKASPETSTILYRLELRPDQLLSGILAENAFINGAWGKDSSNNTLGEKQTSYGALTIKHNEPATLYIRLTKNAYSVYDVYNSHVTTFDSRSNQGLIPYYVITTSAVNWTVTRVPELPFPLTPTPTPTPVSFNFTLPDSIIIQSYRAGMNTSLNTVASWVWNSTNADVNAAVMVASFELKFTSLSVNPIPGRLEFIVDDSVIEISVNGKVASTTNFGINALHVVTSDIIFVYGTNVVQFKCLNSGAAGCFIAVVKNAATGAILSKTDASTRTLTLPALIHRRNIVSRFGNQIRIMDAIGRLYCWGENINLNLGLNGGSNPVTTPQHAWIQSAYGIYRVDMAVSGQSHGIIYDGYKKNILIAGAGWDGSNPSSGTSNAFFIPIVKGSMENALDLIDLAAGIQFNAAVDSSGNLHVWGRNTSGQLGMNTITNIEPPANASIVSGSPLVGKRIVKVSAGSDFMLALDSSGRVYAMGNQTNGRLGNGQVTASSVRMPIDITTNFPGGTQRIIEIEASVEHSMALDVSGNVYAWGSCANGRIGNNSSSGVQSTPIRINTFGSLTTARITQLCPGGNCSIALDSSGRVHAWGINANGLTQSNVPYLVPNSGLSAGTLAGRTPVKVYAGFNGTFYILDSLGTLHGWGSNTTYELGNNSNIDTLTPVQCINVTPYYSAAPTATSTPTPTPTPTSTPTPTPTPTATPTRTPTPTPTPTPVSFNYTLESTVVVLEDKTTPMLTTLNSLAKWVWNTETANYSAPAHTVTFEIMCYNTTGAPIPGRLEFIVDDNVTNILLNNSVTLSDKTYVYNTFHTVSGFTLLYGANMMRITANNTGGPAGLIAVIKNNTTGAIIAKTDMYTRTTITPEPVPIPVMFLTTDPSQNYVNTEIAPWGEPITVWKDASHQGNDMTLNNATTSTFGITLNNTSYAATSEYSEINGSVDVFTFTVHLEVTLSSNPPTSLQLMQLECQGSAGNLTITFYDDKITYDNNGIINIGYFSTGGSRKLTLIQMMRNVHLFVDDTLVKTQIVNDGSFLVKRVILANGGHSVSCTYHRFVMWNLGLSMNQIKTFCRPNYFTPNPFPPNPVMHLSTVQYDTWIDDSSYGNDLRWYYIGEPGGGVANFGEFMDIRYAQMASAIKGLTNAGRFSLFIRYSHKYSAYSSNQTILEIKPVVTNPMTAPIRIGTRSISYEGAFPTGLTGDNEKDIVVVCNSGMISIHQNGSASAASIGSIATYPQIQSITAGRNSDGSNQIDAIIKKMVIFDTILSPTQIFNLSSPALNDRYLFTKPTFSRSNMVLYLDESWFRLSSGYFCDMSQYNNHFTKTVNTGPNFSYSDLDYNNYPPTPVSLHKVYRTGGLNGLVDPNTFTMVIRGTIDPNSYNNSLNAVLLEIKPVNTSQIPITIGIDRIKIVNTHSYYFGAMPNLYIVVVMNKGVLTLYNPANTWIDPEAYNIDLGNQSGFVIDQITIGMTKNNENRVGASLFKIIMWNEAMSIRQVQAMINEEYPYIYTLTNADPPLI